jgi:hypothetical protein
MKPRDLVLLLTVVVFFLAQWPYVEPPLALLDAFVGVALAWQARRDYHLPLDNAELERHRAVALELLREQPEGEPTAVRTLCLSVLDLTTRVKTRKAG